MASLSVVKSTLERCYSVQYYDIYKVFTCSDFHLLVETLSAPTHNSVTGLVAGRVSHNILLQTTKIHFQQAAVSKTKQNEMKIIKIIQKIL